MPRWGTPADPLPMDDLTAGWLAGLLEGEGCFHLAYNRYPRISLQMTDYDVVRQAQAVTGAGRINGPYQTGSGRKKSLRWIVSDRIQVEHILIRIYPLMGARRQEKILLCLSHKGATRELRKFCKRAGHPLTPENTYVPPGRRGNRRCITCYINHYGYPPIRRRTDHGGPVQLSLPY